jgi:hypothetical protein
MPKLPADMTGKLYKAFDSYNIMETVQQRISEWAEHDLGLKFNSIQHSSLGGVRSF